MARRPYHAAVAALAWGIGCAGVAAGTPSLVRASAAVTLAALAALRAWTLAAACAACVLLGGAIGAARIHAIEEPFRHLPLGQTTSLRVILLERPRVSAFGSQAEVRVASGPGRGARLLARAPQSLAVPEALSVGAELRVRGTVHALRSRAALMGELLERVRLTGVRRGGIAGALDGLRRRAERAVAAGLQDGDAALALGMVLGEDEQIDDATRDDWRDAGLAHLLAVSGQNVMLLMALALPLLVAAGLGPRGRGVALLCLVALYVPLAGAGPSLQRAGVMGAAGIAAMTLSRPSSRWYALLLAAAATLALNPRACGEPGWQLSFVAVAGILVAGRPLSGWLRRIAGELAPAQRGALFRAAGDGLCEGIAITVAATIATAPLLAYHFGAVPLAGLAANLLALPAVAPAMWLGMVKAALGAAGPLLPLGDRLAELLGPLTRVPIAYLDGLAERCATLPGGSLRLPLHSPASVVAAYGAMTALLYAPRLASIRRPRRTRPGALELAASWRRSPRSLRAALSVLVTALLVLAAATVLATPAPPGALTIRFLDVGQGDATLIQDGAGAAALFDGGPPEARVYRHLRAAGVRRLDLVVATHQSRDHQGGLAEVLERIPTSLLLENSDGTRDRDFRRLLAGADARGIRRIRAHAGQHLRVGRLEIELLSPAPLPPGAPRPEDPNPRGVAAIVSSGDFDLWLSADAESDAILPLPLRPVEAMKVSHHGSADPGLPEVLDRLSPSVAAIEVGAGNSYGHPTPGTLAALRAAVPHVYRTDRDGTVTLTVRNGDIAVDTER